MNIFVALGTQPFPMDRLLQELDRLVASGLPEGDTLFAQTGHSEYQPKHYPFQAFLPREDYARKIAWADLLITHAGAGTILEAVSTGKRVIVCPRKKEYKEHVDDHQQQLAQKFQELGCVLVYDGQPLADLIEEAKHRQFTPYCSVPSRIPQLLVQYVEGSATHVKRKTKAAP